MVTLKLEVEGLVLASPSLTIEDKQKLIAVLGNLSEEKLTQIKQALENEARFRAEIDKKESAAWGRFKTGLLNSISNG